jgi:hypothetical protein
VFSRRAPTKTRNHQFVVEAPFVKPALMPDTLKEYFLPPRSRTPSLPPTPMTRLPGERGVLPPFGYCARSIAK